MCLMSSFTRARTDPRAAAPERPYKEQIDRSRLHPSARAWDFLSLDLAVVASNLAGHRKKSPDGWTREFELDVAVADPTFWNSQRDLVRRLLGFLTTDVWAVNFMGGGFCPKPRSNPCLPSENCVSLLSGGLDSFIGNVDLVAGGKRPFAVSQTVLGDAENQRAFAKLLGGGLRHLQMNHNAEVPQTETPSTPRCSAVGVLLAPGMLAAAIVFPEGINSNWGKTYLVLAALMNAFLLAWPVLWFWTWIGHSRRRG